MPPNPKGELVCCDHCGRDTTARSGTCAVCIGPVRRPFPSRGGRDPRVIYGSPVDDDPEASDEYIPRKGEER